MTMYEWAKNEVDIACKREAPDREDGEWDYGCACYESALKAYKALMDDGHSGFSFGLTKQILIRLMDGKPLTPIEDIPEVWELISDEDDKVKQYQCTRMGSLFKYVYPDGRIKYSDCERYYCQNVGEKVSYNGGGAGDILNEYYPITFPYLPPDRKYKILTKEYLTNRANGDFDTKVYLSITTPNNECICIDRYFGEVDGKWQEISQREFGKRVNAHWKREKEEAAKETDALMKNEGSV